MGAVQLEQFGASIYVADAVGIGMVRDMSAMMTAIIMAGRTGAAYAAQLGTMKVTQEIDALNTMGVSPIEFLVLPRVVALLLMMPLLCIYSDFIGILGGAAVGAGMLGITLNSFVSEAMRALTIGGAVGGIVKATVYGGDRRGGGMFARNAMRQQRIGGRRRGHGRGRNRHRLHRGGVRHLRGDIPHPQHLKARKRLCRFISIIEDTPPTISPIRRTMTPISR